ncbi:MAG TPA: hypothetical protein VGS19_11275 [Streptosporangiaceae bacterium]|nr:hypothetical protein [Streptosporangiaceae bacterium]
MKARLLAAAAILVSVTACSGQGSSSASGSGPAPDYSHPFLHERQTTVAGAQAAAGFPVHVPNAPLANAKTLAKVWVSPPLHQVALVFDHGKVTIMMWPAIYHNAMAFFRKSMAGMSGKNVIEQVNGYPVLVTFPHTDRTRANPAWVEFDLHSVDTNVVSQTYGTAALLAIARSMTSQASAP